MNKAYAIAAMQRTGRGRLVGPSARRAAPPSYGAAFQRYAVCGTPALLRAGRAAAATAPAGKRTTKTEKKIHTRKGKNHKNNQCLHDISPRARETALFSAVSFTLARMKTIFNIFFLLFRAGPAEALFRRAAG